MKAKYSRLVIFSYTGKVLTLHKVNVGKPWDNFTEWLHGSDKAVYGFDVTQLVSFTPSKLYINRTIIGGFAIETVDKLPKTKPTLWDIWGF